MGFSPPNEKFWFSGIFLIVIPIVIQKCSATPQNSRYKLFFFGILVHMIALQQCAKEQLAWLDVVKIRAPYSPGVSMETRIIIRKICIRKICIRTISQNYRSELSVRTISQNYQSELSVRTISKDP